MNLKKLVLPLVLVPLLLSGCIGKREINDLAMVMAVAIDKGKNDNVKVTVQIARPADARGQTGAPAGSTGEPDPIWSGTAEGETLFEAIRNLTTFSTRRIFWAHNYVIVINEDLAKRGISDVIDFFTRNPELRMNTWVVVTPNKASDIISTMTGLEVIPGEAIDKLFRYTNIAIRAPRTKMQDLESAFLSESSEPVLARVRLISRGVSNKRAGQAGSVKQVDLSGAGVFKGDKLVGTLTGNETRGLLPFIEKIESGVFALSCPRKPSKKISAELIHERFSVIPEYKNGKPKFKIKWNAYMRIVEAGCPISLKDKQQIKDLEGKVETELRSAITTVLHKVLSEYKTDILELGKVFQNKYPSEWKKFKHHWSDVLPTVSTSIDINVEIDDSSLLYNPTKEHK